MTGSYKTTSARIGGVADRVAHSLEAVLEREARHLEEIANRVFILRASEAMDGGAVGTVGSITASRP